MSTDVLTLGGFAFTDYSTPTVMMGGGKQRMIVHKLPGGARVIDTLGPDDDEIRWQGQFFSDTAYEDALLLDSMRSAGGVLPLTWGGQYRSVIISSFIYRVRRLPVWVEYEICCTVATNPMQGDLSAGFGGASTAMDSLVSDDLSSASDASILDLQPSDI